MPRGSQPVLAADLVAGDEIVLLASSGLHANGASLGRKVADCLTDISRHYPAGGRGRGPARTKPDLREAGRRLIAEEVPVHYLSHITSHGPLKLMRTRRELTYRLDALPPVPEVLAFLVEQAEMSPAAAYSTFNMGCGFAVYCASWMGAEVVAQATAASSSANSTWHSKAAT